MSAIDPTDILALVLLAVFSVRRSEVRATDPRAFPHVAEAEFERWRTLAVRARTVCAHACFAKAGLNTLWFIWGRSHLPPAVLAAGGRALFGAWLLALATGLFLGFRAAGIARRLGVVEGRRLAAPGAREEGAPEQKP